MPYFCVIIDAVAHKKIAGPHPEKVGLLSTNTRITPACLRGADINYVYHRYYDNSPCQ